MTWIRGALEPIWLHEPAVRDGRGPERVQVDKPDPNFRPRPVGFTANVELAEPDPLTWKGDDG